MPAIGGEHERALAKHIICLLPFDWNKPMLNSHWMTHKYTTKHKCSGHKLTKCRFMMKHNNCTLLHHICRFLRHVLRTSTNANDLWRTHTNANDHSFHRRILGLLGNECVVSCNMPSYFYHRKRTSSSEH